VQVVPHPEPMQVNGEQPWAVAARQVPAPSQVRAGWKVALLTHAAAWQTVPAPQVAQDAAPEHPPLFPQPDAAWAGHSPSGSVPGAAEAQKPLLAARSHRWQVPPHRDSQQTWSVQNPLAQSPSVLQPSPGPARHRPSTAQTYPSWQSEVDPHAERTGGN